VIRFLSLGGLCTANITGNLILLAAHYMASTDSVDGMIELMVSRRSISSPENPRIGLQIAPGG
jgi:hypothetical protein